MIKTKNAKTKDIKICKPLFVPMTFLVVVQVFLANSLSVQGKEISRLEGFKGDLEKEINQLRVRSSTLSSLDSIRELAKQRLSMTESLDSFDHLGSSVALR
jgi:cell division protein FtsB